MLAKTGKSQEVNGIVIILRKTSHAPSLTLQVCDFRAVASSYCLCSKQLLFVLEAATVCARSSCMRTIGTVWFMMRSDAFCTFLGWLSHFLHRFSQ